MTLRIGLGLLLGSLFFVNGQSVSAQNPASPSDRAVLERPVTEYETPYRESPRDYITRKAQFAAEQRALRLESMKWYGYSVARPMSNPHPLTGAYTANWHGSWYNARHWSVGLGSRIIVVEP